MGVGPWSVIPWLILAVVAVPLVVMGLGADASNAGDPRRGARARVVRNGLPTAKLELSQREGTNECQIHP